MRICSIIRETPWELTESIGTNVLQKLFTSVVLRYIRKISADTRQKHPTYSRVSWTVRASQSRNRRRRLLLMSVVLYSILYTAVRNWDDTTWVTRTKRSWVKYRKISYRITAVAKMFFVYTNESFVKKWKIRKFESQFPANDERLISPAKIKRIR